MKPNILFIVIDSLRADKCHGEKKTSVTPNIDSLIENGTYFSQNITAAPSTIPSISSIFTSLYPFECVIQEGNFFVINPEIKNYIKNLERNEYSCYATIPILMSYLGFDKIFKNKLETFERTSTLYNGLGNKIMNRIESFSKDEPWFYYIHLYDLMWISDPANFNPNDGPDEIRDLKYGENQYERIFSVMDIWLGKIFKKLDMKNTLIVITADHGTDIGVYNSKMEESNKVFQGIRKRNSGVGFKIGQKIAHKFPKSMLPVRKKLAEKYTSKADEEIKERIKPEIEKIENSELRPYEKRLMKYSIFPITDLYDDKYVVPVIFSGHNVPTKKMITQQVQSVDIFPTIAGIIGMNTSNYGKRGRDLMPIIKNDNFDEVPAYIETATNSIKTQSNNTIGIRTSEYKYFRDRNEKTKNVHLYDLKNDPLEEYNISEKNEDIIKKMESILVGILQGDSFQHSQSDEEFEEEKANVIESELKRLGYIN